MAMGSGPCIPGAQLACACPGAATGVQVCAADGESLGRCVCDDASRRGDTAGGTSGPGSGGSGWNGSGGTGGSAGRGGTNPGAVAGAGGGSQLGECTATALRSSVVDAEYSAALDRVVLLLGGPNQVGLLDPSTGIVETIDLPLAGAAVSVAPDGLTAAVAHNANLSLIDLVQPALLKTIGTTSDAEDVVLAGNGFAYVFPKTDQWVEIHSVELAAGIDHGDAEGWSIYAGTRAKLHLGGDDIYGIDPALSPTDIERYDISGGVARVAEDSPYHGDFPICEDIWMSQDGLRVFTACGTAFRTAPGTDQDMTYNGALEDTEVDDYYGARFRYIAHDLARSVVYAVPRASSSSYWEDVTGPEEAELRVFEYEFLTLRETWAIPCLETGVGKTRLLGRFVFPAASGVYVLGVAENVASLNPWALAVITP